MGLPPRRRKDRIALLELISGELGWNRLSGGAVAVPGFDLSPNGRSSLVFDIDGVLLDTHRSFREVIPRSVNLYLEAVLRQDVEAPLMKSEDVHTYKSVGGFNNDWDVAEAGLIHALWCSRFPESAPSLSDLADRMAERGGGLEAAREILREEVGAREAEGLLRDVDRGTLERIFKELYVGGRRFLEVFGEEPRYFKGTGAMEREVPLAEGPVWDRVRQVPFGILTGRIPPEARLALERLGITDVMDPGLLVTDDGTYPTKPDPTGLLYLAGRLASRPLFYFGDNRDDLSALLGARDRLKDGDLHFVYCLSGSTDEETVRWFAGNGASLMAVEVTDALAALLA